MKNITRAELIPLVIAEATKLKANALKDELANLNFSSLNADLPSRCIYGQMTGNCFNDRAVSLIEKSCEKVIVNNPNRSGVNGPLNGSPKGSDRDLYWSPIEVYIYRNQSTLRYDKQNKVLIDFLRGETETLNLK